MPKHYDLAVLCAKCDELEQLQAVFRKEFTKVSGDRLVDQIYKFDTPNGTKRLIVMTCGEMGHTSAAVQTGRLIIQHHPKVIFFVGTAASLCPNEVQLGDVLVPRKAVYRMYDKISEKGQSDYERRMNGMGSKEQFFGENVLCADTATTQISPDMLGALSGVRLDERALKSGETKEIELEGRRIQLRAPKIFKDEDIFSCGMVVDSLSYREFISGIAKEEFRKLKIIDMESFGFYSAIDHAKKSGVGSDTEGVMIRGVSDYAGRKQQTETRPEDWKSVCVTNAAIVAAQIIKDIYTPHDDEEDSPT
ncbi:phosphorylase family protein [Rhodovulum sulfidophilum]|uniref:phosphorylase family protein n=1 Tax=Rhodovulum sulfidophilum TaxID=35806 RepID=UPI0009525DA4|nr:hypothetical protein [Rhodovulum sulfidophilum]MBL3552570.1 hypothetical protein [Rhodovulum sulfidophilum]OLS46841.1 hypothetical protein BV379_00070 [Rhodovulum sulfidophilum]